MLNVSLPPHITSRYRLKQWQVRRLAAMAPMTFSALDLFGTGFLYCLLAGLAGSVLLPLTIKRWRRNFLDPVAALFTASLLALLMPEGSVWYYSLLAGLAVSGVKNILSEKDRLAPINFVALTMALFILATPDNIRLAYHWEINSGGWAKGNFYFMTGWIPLAGSLFLLMLFTGRLYKVRLLLLSLLSSGAVIFLAWKMTGNLMPNTFSYAGLQALLFLAGILAVDNHHTPLTGRGQAIYGMISGMLFALFALKGLLYQGLIFSALTASLFTPFLDCLFTGGYRRTKT
ncbi:RnfABCDGE type electron transport complex subunit D [candidate division TA06 bacterium]|uniref:RnfABCDGE type electron transport complex subunit D n=1 Tax=candidate division TA06 bacterium TaxID=2250710 RepID=A0A933IBL8_UNCT6|nr:RnfABCDGE type electron transport complex subunit D [candidate division TA06 bacterium]